MYPGKGTVVLIRPAQTFYERIKVHWYDQRIQGPQTGVQESSPIPSPKPIRSDQPGRKARGHSGSLPTPLWETQGNTRGSHWHRKAQPCTGKLADLLFLDFSEEGRGICSDHSDVLTYSLGSAKGKSDVTPSHPSPGRAGRSDSPTPRPFPAV